MTLPISDLSGLSITSPSSGRIIKDEYSAGSSSVELIDPPSVSPVAGLSSVGGNLADNGQSILNSSGQTGGSVSVAASSSGAGTSQAQTVQHHPPSSGPSTSTGLNQFGGLAAGAVTSRIPSGAAMIPPGSKSPTDELSQRNQGMGGQGSQDSSFYSGDGISN